MDIFVYIFMFVFVKLSIIFLLYIGTGFGMTRMITFDGTAYRFRVRGKFWIVREGGFSIQGETIGISKTNGKVALNYPLD